MEPPFLRERVNFGPHMVGFIHNITNNSLFSKYNVVSYEKFSYIKVSVSA